MKVKIAALIACAAAGGYASVALADHGHEGDHHGTADCQKVHVRGTLAAGSLTVTPNVRRVRDRSETPTTTSTTAATTTTTPATPAGPVTIAVPAGAQVEATACLSGTTLSLKEAEIHVRPAPPAPGTTPTVTVTTTQTVTTTKP